MGEDQPQTRRRLTVAEAAALGVSVEAIRGRVKRKTLEVEREPGGKVFVLLDADQTQSESTALISAKDETIATLREQLEAEREAHAEARRLLLRALEKIPPAIEAPLSPGPGDTPPVYRGDTPPVTREGSAGSQTGSERPQERSSLWQRLFGG